MNVTHQKINFGSFSSQMRDRSGFQGAFWNRVLAEPSVTGRVLNIGCGPTPLEPELEIRRRVAQFDGVDPDPAVLNYPSLAQRWHNTLEEAAIPPNAYDLAWSYNVVEHVRYARPFFDKLRAILKPGGVFWALTPNGRHPFCSAVKLLQIVGIKQRMAEHNHHVNKIPSYYRLNTASAVLRASRDLGFSSVQFYYLPCLQWDLAFPRALRFAPRSFDYLIGTRLKRYALVFAYRLQVQI